VALCLYAYSYVHTYLSFRSFLFNLTQPESTYPTQESHDNIHRPICGFLYIYFWSAICLVSNLEVYILVVDIYSFHRLGCVGYAIFTYLSARKMGRKSEYETCSLGIIVSRCYDHNLLRFSTIFGEKIGVFLKNQCYHQNFA
jgi:hypothetical protein